MPIPKRAIMNRPVLSAIRQAVDEAAEQLSKLRNFPSIGYPSINDPSIDVNTNNPSIDQLSPGPDMLGLPSDRSNTRMSSPQPKLQFSLLDSPLMMSYSQPLMHSVNVSAECPLVEATDDLSQHDDDAPLWRIKTSRLNQSNNQSINLTRALALEWLDVEELFDHCSNAYQIPINQLIVLFIDNQGDSIVIDSQKSLDQLVEFFGWDEAPAFPIHFTVSSIMDLTCQSSSQCVSISGRHVWYSDLADEPIDYDSDSSSEASEMTDSDMSIDEPMHPSAAHSVSQPNMLSLIQIDMKLDLILTRQTEIERQLLMIHNHHISTELIRQSLRPVKVVSLEQGVQTESPVTVSIGTNTMIGQVNTGTQTIEHVVAAISQSNSDLFNQANNQSINLTRARSSSDYSELKSSLDGRAWRAELLSSVKTALASAPSSPMASPVIAPSTMMVDLTIKKFELGAVRRGPTEPKERLLSINTTRQTIPGFDLSDCDVQLSPSTPMTAIAFTRSTPSVKRVTIEHPLSIPQAPPMNKAVIKRSIKQQAIPQAPVMVPQAPAFVPTLPPISPPAPPMNWCQILRVERKAHISSDPLIPHAPPMSNMLITIEPNTPQVEASSSEDDWVEL